MSSQIQRKGSDDDSRSNMLQMITGFWISQAIYVAAKLGIADLLKDGPKHVDEIAETAGSAPRETFRLLRTLSSVDIFAETDDGLFEQTPLSTCLRSDVEESLRSLAIMYGEETYRAWGSLHHSIRSGETAFEHEFGSNIFHYLASHAEAAGVFNQAMREFTVRESEAVMSAYDFSGFSTIVDIGGGLGSFIIDVLQANKTLVGILFDLPQILPRVGEQIQVAGLADRCEVIGGDFFEAVPQGGDIYVLKNVVVNWDDDKCRKLLRNCRQAMAEGARLLIIEVSAIAPSNMPTFGKLFDLHMLVMTGGYGRSEDEFRRLLSSAGFAFSRILSTESHVSIIECVPISSL